MRRRFFNFNANLVPELELWYKLDNFVTTGKVYDYSGNGLTGTVAEDAIPSYPGFYFDGTGDYINTIETFQSVFQDSFSISAYVRGTDGAIFGVDEVGNVVKVCLSSNTLTAQMDSNGFSTTATEATDSFPTNPTIYRHVVVTFEANTQIRLYVNGAERTLLASPNDGDASGLTFSQYNSGSSPFIGATSADGGNIAETPFTGNIGDLRIYSKLLTPVDAKNIYNIERFKYAS